MALRVNRRTHPIHRLTGAPRRLPAPRLATARRATVRAATVRPAVSAVSDWSARGLRAVLATWPVRGYREANGGQLVAIVAFNSLVALVPTFFLLVSVAGLLLRQDRFLVTAIHAAFWALPGGAARDALDDLAWAQALGG